MTAATLNAGRPRATIVCFSHIESDGRVLRQVAALARDFDVTVIGYGAPDANLPGGARFLPVPAPTTFWRRNATAIPKLALGRLLPSFGYARWYWDRPDHARALALAEASAPTLIIANDWTGLPVAAVARERTGARVVLDLHEYGPLQLAGRRAWMLLVAPMIVHTLHKYGPLVQGFITVSQTIADRYKSEFGFDCIVVTNAPELTDEPPFHATASKQVRIVHHGAPVPDRKLEVLIEAVGSMQPRFSLTFLFLNSESAYVTKLKRLAERVAPGRVHFEKAVPPDAVVRTIAAYDVGTHILPPVSFNHDAALPNKLFDFICAGLALCITPSPEMARVVRERGVGVVAKDFEPASLARAMNALDAEQIDAFKRRSIAVRAELSAKTEMRKLRALCRRVAGLPTVAD